MIDPKEELEEGIRENLVLVLDLLRDRIWSYAITGHVRKRDYQCVSIEWPRKGLYCYIFNDSVFIDKVMYNNGNILHNEAEIPISELSEKFIEYFSARI